MTAAVVFAFGVGLLLLFLEVTALPNGGGNYLQRAFLEDLIPAGSASCVGR